MTLESDCLERGSNGWQSTSSSDVSGALPIVHENPGEPNLKVRGWLTPALNMFFHIGRTHNRIRSPRFEASSR